jgi:hypothetical protein
MFKLVKFAIGLTLVAVMVWFGACVPLGDHTLFGHMSRIWDADETQDLVEGTKKSAGPAVDRVKRGVKAGVREANKQE